MHRLSKSDYLLGLQCPLALWFKHYRKDLDIETSEEKAERELHTDEGNEVGKWAKQYFEGGFEVTNLPNPSFSFEKAICQTKKARDEGQRIIFEAAAETSNGLFAQSDILRRNTDDTWDLIEVKSSKRLTEDKESKKDKDHYLDDIGFQYHVFSLAGYNIKRCYFMFLNEEYVRNGTIDPKKLLREELVTDKAIKASNKVASESGRLLGVLNSSSPPTQSIGSHCDKPYVCRYKGECWKDVPLYSIFNVLSKNKASELYKNGIVNVSDLPEQKWSKESKKPIEIEAFLKRKEHVDTEKIVKFLDKIQLPLYFLDYETIECAVPLFDKTSPKQQIPFQFSLHTQKKHGEKITHKEFLHKERTDPRFHFVNTLVNLCDSKGTVIVWNEVFEKCRNNELAEAFPNFRDRLLNINERMVDLLDPFKKRYIYHPDQNGSASLKATFPAFTNLSYDDMAITEGTAASRLYLNYQKGKLPKDQEEKMFSDLSEYCKLDTLAMVELLQVLRSKVSS